MTTPTRPATDLERSVLIRATRPLVFSFFTDSALFERWWGEGSTIDGCVGGAVRIVYPGGVVAVGEVTELVPEERVAFTFGFEDPEKPIAPGESLVTVTLADEADGTRVELRHRLPEELAQEFAQGWRYQLALFANAAAQVAHGDVGATADAWLAAWNEPDEGTRRAAFKAIATPDVRFADAFSSTVGIEDLVLHVGAAHVHMPGVTIAGSGAARACQGVVLADWVASGPDGSPMGQGTNVLDLAPDGRIRSVTGIWSVPS